MQGIRLAGPPARTHINTILGFLSSSLPFPLSHHSYLSLLDRTTTQPLPTAHQPTAMDQHDNIHTDYLKADPLLSDTIQQQTHITLTENLPVSSIDPALIRRERSSSETVEKPKTDSLGAAGIALHRLLSFFFTSLLQCLGNVAMCVCVQRRLSAGAKRTLANSRCDCLVLF
ncbi:hypothetical protein BC939DRAFT_32638 [Gamsiella multidivaricata]|uniref:uncharacterized protein n=1 Tax=Gamsiella multidivaricata TaxID=101098 RepID=UPI00221F552B|nr:uncharacterized protein BC939DRAFT_32638 [Gamsiella multidivaricata]KAI7816705.1 hypothetical protein BC939DRAFT_32638 [Gamsiella multidivaricata]